jgi:hypothetical protein
MVARLAHNQKILGSNPSLATNLNYMIEYIFELVCFIFQIKEEHRQELSAKFVSKQK